MKIKLFGRVFSNLHWLKVFFLFGFLKNLFILKIADVSKFIFMQKAFFQSFWKFNKVSKNIWFYESWMCVEVLSEIYDVVQIIWRTWKLWFVHFLNIFLAFVKIFSQFFFYFVGRQILAYVFGENKSIWKSFQQLTLIESLFFSDFWKIHFLWKLLMLTSLVFYKENFFNLFQNWISFLKIYSCMGLIWMYLEVLTEIYD